MQELEYFKIKAKKYDLIVKEIDDFTICVESNKYNFDFWIVEKALDGTFLIWHRNKKGNRAVKFNVHLHARVKKSSVMFIINSHNQFKAGRVNLVDRVLKSKR